MASHKANTNRLRARLFQAQISDFCPKIKLSRNP